MRLSVSLAGVTWPMLETLSPFGPKQISGCRGYSVSQSWARLSG